MDVDEPGKADDPAGTTRRHPLHRPHEHPHLDHLREDLQQARDAAIDAEFDTGVREDSVEQARTHVLIRLGRMSLAVMLMITGVVLLVLPGPGWLVLAIGFGILAKDVAWAERTVRYIRRKAPGIPEDGRLPASAIVTMVLLALAGVSFSVWYFGLR
ncbi:MAG: hypothetical protein JJLCMIEE_02996 [Acidimicrobiales bacterium]|nr:MAG: hypothetical protein EDR02_03700 [Actinomycetota bacterium]MBV6509883.1 hypothetical protein [Acidimicrobiales bacterium]RIK06180.1 MAG: hypothetical protein DCC48_07040 [Acidobacteriota bacterium]